MASRPPPDPGSEATTVLASGQTTIAAAPQAAMVPAMTAAIAELQPGMCIRQRFELTRRIGTGGMGVVFSALDRIKLEAGDPRHRVAIKILNRELRGHSVAFLALQREASKAQALAHPNIATVHDFDRDGDLTYIVMELLAGQPLDEVTHAARGTGLERGRALQIIRGIAEGLAHAHRRGVVHCDLKPANVFLGEDGTPKLLDFGIARTLPGVATEQDDFDPGRLGAYTPSYATEDMMTGGQPDASDDLYALGLIAYELLSGRHPFERKNARQARELGLVPARLRALPAYQWRVLERCLAFERDRRPRDAGEFLKQFFRSAALRNLAIAAALALVSVGGTMGYLNYRQAGPDQPLSALPAQTRERLQGMLDDAGQEWMFYTREGAEFAAWSSLELYAEAYTLHPRNRDAVAGLERAADALLDAAGDDPDRQSQLADALVRKAEHLRSYPPVAQHLSGAAP